MFSTALFTAEQVASSSSSHCIAWYGEDDVWLNTKGITNSVTKRVGSLLGNKKKGFYFFLLAENG